uniref:Methyltransferase FkbM domain-containing protein n=1 Tax=viral metagenome TaxID=1070528 RepID=A0A6C0DCE5_9ZZZZ
MLNFIYYLLIIVIIFNIKFLKFFNLQTYINTVNDLFIKLKHVLFSKSSCIQINLMNNDLSLCKVKDEYYYTIAKDISIGSRTIRKGYIWDEYLRLQIDKISDINQCAIDIGANIGYHSIYMSKKFKQVYSFEPQKEIFNILNLNIKKNNITNIITYNNAVGNENKKIKLSCSNNSIHNSIKKIDEDGCESVNMIRLDDIQRLNNIGYIKIDVEGYEYNVLLGAINLIKKYRPIIIFEEHNDIKMFDTPNTINLLEELNYEVIRLLPYVDDYIAYPK